MVLRPIRIRAYQADPRRAQHPGRHPPSRPPHPRDQRDRRETHTPGL